MAGAEDFRFLDKYNVELRPLLDKAGSLLASDPDTPYLSAVVCRRYVEVLANEVARRNALPLLGQDGDPKENLGSFIWRLNNAGAIGGKRGVFDDVREAGNAIHANGAIGIGEARIIVNKCAHLAFWFEETAKPFKAPQISQAPQTSKPSGPAGFGQRTTAPKPAARRSRFSGLSTIVLVMVLGAGAVWYLVSIGTLGNPLLPPAPVALFAQPEVFVVTPGGSALHANVRSRPDAAAEVKQVLSRGDQVSGIGRVAGADGASWIELAGDAGFIKESVLRAAAPASPP
ncbi:MAG TPA: hypothetical protein VHZ78_11325 [Rhizomicrobium sp.]|jgi:hypothetical protein|nr:hypothetical protein [Rhizomicrobium sp.]